MVDKRYLEIAAGMFRTGILGYGGGPSVIPLIRYEAVTRYRWMEDEEFGEILALANVLPGPIATKMAAYLGYRQKGFTGALVAVLAHIVPTSIAMVALLSVVQILSGSKIIQGMISAVTPVIAVMIGVMAYEFSEKAVKGLGKLIAVSLFVFIFLLLQIVHLHPAIVISVSLVYGALHLHIVELAKRKRNEGQTWNG
ncbi:chromate transporter [Paenibacillus alkalitolerans]|uniref:chromate transporter n=1 Tax=Paenibacillus alkalitolerans TaxID=2799335 RepID=UPI002D7FAD86|nr:chromate transporter [Paenibacillus alkalitolerans]